jgi:hypothetical protein
MFPTSTLPVSPFLGPTGIGTLLGGLALGALVALVIGYALHRSEQRTEVTVDVPDRAAAEPGAERPPGSRLSA